MEGKKSKYQKNQKTAEEKQVMQKLFEQSNDIREESDYLNTNPIPKKKRIKAQKYLAESRKNIDLQPK